MSQSCPRIAIVAFATLAWLIQVQVAHAQKKQQLSYEKTVAPFLVKHCHDCHSGDQPEAGLNLAKLSADFAGDEIANRWIDVMHALQFGEMPPPEEEQPDSIEKASVIGWVFQEMAETGRYDAYRKKLLAPEYGNWVNHETVVFGRDRHPAVFAVAAVAIQPRDFRVERIRPRPEPVHLRDAGDRDSRLRGDVPGRSEHGADDADQPPSSSSKNGKRRASSSDFAAGQPSLTEQELSDTVKREFRRVIGRDPSPAESAKYLAFLKQNIAVGSGIDGLKTTIKAMFLSPEAIYRMELGLGETDEHGRRHLSPEELAHVLAFALTDRGPTHNRFIRSALEKGELKTKEDVARSRSADAGRATDHGPLGSKGAAAHHAFLRRVFRLRPGGRGLQGQRTKTS